MGRHAIIGYAEGFAYICCWYCELGDGYRVRIWLVVSGFVLTPKSPLHHFWPEPKHGIEGTPDP